jgi:transcriptional regulator with XRE-family HTH domain
VSNADNPSFKDALNAITPWKKSWAEVAEACGITTSSISRLTSGSIVRPSLDMLMRIIRVADFTEELKPERFLALAGFEPVDDPMAEHHKAEEEIRKFVASSLMFSGEQINGASIRPRNIYSDGIRAAWVPDFILETKQHGQWRFDILDDGVFTSRPTGMPQNFQVRMRIFDRLGRILADYPLMPDGKNTIIVGDQNVYVAIVREFLMRKLPIPIYIMLVNIIDKEITEETLLGEPTSLNLIEEDD